MASRFMLPAALVIAGTAAWCALGSPPVLVIPLAWLGALWLPGAAWTVSPSVTRSWEPGWWRGFALGPVILGAGICGGRSAGLGLTASALAVVAVSAGVAAVRWRRGAGTTIPDAPEPDTRRGEDRGERDHPGSVWVAGGLAFLLGAVPALAYEPLRLLDDARLHLPIAQRILAGSFPPENPFLAGADLAYFWFYHVVLAGAARLTELPLESVPGFFNLQALLVWLFALEAAGRRLGLTPRARAAALLFLGAGLTPWGAYYAGFLRLSHPEVNWALVRAHGISGLLPLLNPLEPRLAASFTKVALANALPMSLALCLLALTPVRGRVRDWVLRAVWTAGTLFFHLAIGGLLVAGLVGRWVVTRAADPKNRTHNPERSPVTLAAALTGAAITLPYLLSVLTIRGEGSFHRITFQPGHALALHLSLILLWVLTLAALSRWKGGGRRTWLLSGVPAFLLPWGLHLVDGNEYKTVFFLLGILALPAGAGLMRLTRNRLPLAGLVLLLCVPTPFLAARAYVQESREGAWDGEEFAAYRAAGSELPLNAVIWRPEIEAGYSRDTVALDRVQFLSDTYALQILGQWTIPEARRRRESLEPVHQGRPAESARLASAFLSPRPVAAVLNRDDLRRWPRLPRELLAAGARETHTTSYFRVFLLSPEPPNQTP